MNEFTRSGKSRWASWLSGALLVCIIVVTGTQANAGPFGLEMGMTRAQIEKKCGKLQPLGNSAYKAETVPGSYRDLKQYVLGIDEEVGLFKIVSSTNIIKTSRYGDQIIEQFDSIKKNLTSRYGLANELHDEVQSGSYLDKPEYWTMAILKKERILSAYWDNDSSSKSMGNVLCISLEVDVEQIDEGSVTLSYEFENIKVHSARREKQDQDKL